MSIYTETRAKLDWHGLSRTEAGRALMADLALRLLFVRLQRALATGDFAAVQGRTDAIERYLTARGRREFTVFAYLYVRHGTFCPGHIRAEEIEGEGFRVETTYPRRVGAEEIAICAWARALYERQGPAMLRAVYHPRGS